MKERMPKMRKFEEDDSVENLIKTMVWDPIERNEEMEYFIKFLSSMETNNKVIAVNGKWGSGKTFFLKQFQLLCNYSAGRLKEKIKIEEYINRYNDARNIKGGTNFFSLLQSECEEFVNEECCEVLYFNAWEYDGNDDPIKSLMYFLIENYNYDYKKIEVDWKELGKKAIRFLTGLEYGKDCVEVGNSFGEIISNNDIRRFWVTLLDEIIAENCNKIYIIIDDLDRCRPKYVLKMFERLKHFANDERVVFIMAIDYEEVLCMVNHFYGYKENGNRFLEKVIDQFIDLENRQYEDYREYLGDFINNQTREEGYLTISNIIGKVANCVFEDFHMTLREIARYAEIIQYIFAFYNERIGRHGGDLGNTILKGIVMPYVLGLYIISKKEYYQFIRGEGKSKFIFFIESHKDLLTNMRIDQQNINQVFEDVYEFIVCVMSRDKDYIESRDIGNMRLYEDTVRYVFQCINRMYDFEMRCNNDESELIFNEYLMNHLRECIIKK